MSETPRRSLASDHPSPPTARSSRPCRRGHNKPEQHAEVPTWRFVCHHPVQPQANPPDTDGHGGENHQIAIGFAFYESRSRIPLQLRRGDRSGAFDHATEIETNSTALSARCAANGATRAPRHTRSPANSPPATTPVSRMYQSPRPPSAASPKNAHVITINRSCHSAAANDPRRSPGTGSPQRKGGAGHWLGRTARGPFPTNAPVSSPGGT